MRDVRHLEEMDPPRTESRLCNVKGCGRTTREKKPFCPDHIDELPYVQQLMAQIDYKAAELERVRSGKPVPVPSCFEGEIVWHLKMNGRRSVRRLAKEVHIEYVILIKMLRAYKRRGLIKFYPHHRRSEDYIVGAV